MSKIQEYLSKIATAVYGKDVRQSIIDAINQCYEDAIKGVDGKDYVLTNQDKNDIANLIGASIADGNEVKY